MRKQRILCLCMASLLVLSLASCGEQADEQDSTPPTASVQPTIKPTPTPEPTPPIPYTDVAEDSPYYNAVVWAYENGIASDGSTFEPDSACTRGQVMTFLWRAKGSPEPQTTESPFNDVSSADWFYKPALWAYENGVATGTAFKPGNPCTNAEALTFLWRAEGKPAAAVHNSAVALAASGQYYARPAAWAETNGLFAGADFDPAAPCSRADLMTYLYWLTEEWAFTEEDKTVQTEYEQIINDAQLFEVHGSGLLYADYVDVDGDGKAELLTVDSGENLSTMAGWFGYDVTATVYTNIDGHAGKLCEQTFDFTSRHCVLYAYVYDGHVYICYEIGVYGPHNAFYKIEDGAFILSEQIDEEMGAYYINNSEVSETEYNAAIGKYTNQKKLFWYDNGDSISVVDRGLLPSAEEYWAKALFEVDGKAVSLSADPYTKNGTIMVPLRDVLEAMGVTVYANSDVSVILASTRSDTLVITYKDFSDYSFKGINSTYYGSNKTYKYSMNGGKFQSIAIEFTNGKAYLPLQTLVSLFGGTAEWGDKAEAISITSNIPGNGRMTQDDLKQMANFDMKQAQKIAVNKGYETPDIPDAGGTGHGLTFKNGKAVWSLYTPDKGSYGELYRVDIANDGTVTAYPNDRAYQAGPT